MKKKLNKTKKKIVKKIQKPSTKTGRPCKELNWIYFEKLCDMEFTLKEIACFFDCSEDTIERFVKREKKMTFAEFVDRYYKKGAEAVNDRIKIDWETFDGLCSIMCTLKEIAHFFSCSESTIRRRVNEEKKVTFQEYFNKKCVNGLISLRRYQFNLAKTNSSMAIFLGKNYLEQKDRQELEHKGNMNNYNFNMTEGEIDERIKELEAKIRKAEDIAV